MFAGGNTCLYGYISLILLPLALLLVLRTRNNTIFRYRFVGDNYILPFSIDCKLARTDSKSGRCSTSCSVVVSLFAALYYTNIECENKHINCYVYVRARLRLVCGALRMCIFKNDSENWSGQNWTSRNRLLQPWIYLLKHMSHYRKIRIISTRTK